MPRVFRIGKYTIYFWMNEGYPPEPVHVHVAEGDPVPNATKIWIRKDGRAFLANNNSRIPLNKLTIIIRTIEARVNEIIAAWQKIFGEVKFYC